MITGAVDAHGAIVLVLEGIPDTVAGLATVSTGEPARWRARAQDPPTPARTGGRTDIVISGYLGDYRTDLAVNNVGPLRPTMFTRAGAGGRENRCRSRHLNESAAGRSVRRSMGQNRPSIRPHPT